MSDWRMRAEAVRVRSLVRVERETDEVWTLYFRDGPCSQASPGQYVMAWAPGVDEVPMSLSAISRDGMSSVTVRSVGDATRALCGSRAGDRIGVRGPFGRGFSILGASPLVVGGGTGAASLVTLVEAMIGGGVEPTFVLGARNVGRLLFKKRLERLLGDRLIPATDDGSCGFRGFASECALRMMEEERFDGVYMCGPELMMASIFNAAEERDIPAQASLERYIKCAVGLCGSCGIGPYRVCKDGPVFTSEQLRAVREELGRRRMDPSGRMVEVDH
ncbi:MAG: dihydroorotate dehydrogenase electron transfer subunit [Candidatus Bathyarchaeota archaeon]|nr:dihydroorotate dehydrogenase electron transfer subunit [Candidatus Bathyarchaeota archaeon]